MEFICNLVLVVCFFRFIRIFDPCRIEWLQNEGGRKNGKGTQTGFRNSVKIIVGGAPVTRAFAHQNGADGYGYDSAGAAQKCKELVSA